jgi:hypothetical protein
MNFVTWRKVVYAVWLFSAGSIYFNFLPAFVEILDRSLFEFGSYRITLFFILTSLSVLLLTSSVSSKIVSWADVCSRSSGLTFLTAFVVIVGIVATIDLVVAFATQQEPFIIVYFFSLFMNFLPG